MHECNFSLVEGLRSNIELPCEIRYLQKAQLSQSGRATLRVFQDFAKLPKIIRNYTVG